MENISFVAPKPFPEDPNVVGFFGLDWFLGLVLVSFVIQGSLKENLKMNGVQGKKNNYIIFYPILCFEVFVACEYLWLRVRRVKILLKCVVYI